MHDGQEKGWRYWFFMGILVTSFGLVLVRALDLMVIKHGYYEQLARDNRVVEKKIPAARGEIVDRKGRVVAESIYEYYKTDVNGAKEYVAKGDYQGDMFEGMGQSYTLKRQYPYGESMALVSGYVGRVNSDDIQAAKCGTELSPNELIGRGGVESSQNCWLQGSDGKRLIEVDAKGNYVRELGRAEPDTGKTLELSIDAYWQDKIYKMLGGKRAVVIISQPKTGKVLAMVSSPSYDPNAFSYNQDNTLINQYLSDNVNLPLLNRAVAGQYHPGSVFKIVVSAGGLEENVITRTSTYEDTGIIKIGPYSYSNWLWTKRGITDGMVDIVTAIRRSNDIFFYKLGGDMGVDRIKTWARKFGYGSKTGVELDNELPGIVPDEQWKIDNTGEKWFLGDTYHYAIGQGALNVTPLQVNQMTNVIANDGTLCSMSILKNSPEHCHSLGIKPETIAIIKQGMEGACKPGGTAWPLFNFKTMLACKTGTAEVGDGSKDTHAWLTAFAPADNPQISITVLVERGGEGSDVAAPIVGDILKAWFNEPDTLVPRYNSDGKVTNIGD